MAVNDTVQLSVKGKVIGQDHVHTLHFRFQDLLATEQGLIDAWQASCRTAYRGLFKSPDEPVQLITAQQVCGAVPLRAIVEETEVVGSRVGTLASGSDFAPPHEAAVVSIRTGLSGKSRRGRSYIGGLLDDNMSSGVLAAPYIALLNTYYAALLATFGVGGTSGSYLWAIHSRTLAAVPGTQCQDSSALVSTFIIRSEVGTMRSRKIGHGD